MKWLIVCLLVLFTVAPAIAGEDPYIAVVGNDINANPFYLSPKYTQFLRDQGESLSYPVDGEFFNHQSRDVYPEICDTTGTASGGPPFESENQEYTDRGNPNFRVPANNSGWYEWLIVLTKKPSSEINLVLQCGILKADAFAFHGYSSVELCAGETGERYGGLCARKLVDPGFNPIKPASLPHISARAIAGINSRNTGGVPLWTPFHLTAFRNPGSYQLNVDANGDLLDSDAVPAGISGSLQILDGADGGGTWGAFTRFDPDSKVLLKACMDKTVVAKIPVTGQVNALGEVENDLVEGDLIDVLLYLPRGNSVDVYCHSQSLKVMGIGED
jgi:hypothetical protein